LAKEIAFIHLLSLPLGFAPLAINNGHLC